MSARWIIGTSAAFLFTACAHQPYTREEFRAVVVKGAFSAKADTFVVNKSFDQAVPYLTPKTDACLNKVVERSTVQGCTPARDLRRSERKTILAQRLLNKIIRIDVRSPRRRF